VPRTAEDKRAENEAVEWTRQQMADPNAADVTYAVLIEKFGISERAAHRVATVTRFHRVNQHIVENVNADSRTGMCTRCGPVKVWKRTREYGVNWFCSTVGTERNRAYSSGKRDHGLTKNATKKLREGRLCEVPVCQKPAEAVDHCHESMNIRGVLCRDHNLALGYAHDSIEELEGLIDYLKMTTGVDGLARLGYAG
jgi:hypothetical protein